MSDPGSEEGGLARVGRRRALRLAGLRAAAFAGVGALLALPHGPLVALLVVSLALTVIAPCALLEEWAAARPPTWRLALAAGALACALAWGGALATFVQLEYARATFEAGGDVRAGAARILALGEVLRDGRLHGALWTLGYLAPALVVARVAVPTPGRGPEWLRRGYENLGPGLALPLLLGQAIALPLALALVAAEGKLAREWARALLLGIPPVGAFLFLLHLALLLPLQGGLRRLAAFERRRWPD